MTSEEMKEFIEKANDFEMKGDFNDAEFYAQKIIDFVEELNEKDSTDFEFTINDKVHSSMYIESLLLITRCASKRGNFSQAKENINKTIQVAEIGKRKDVIAQCYNILGIVYRNQGEYDKALENFQNSVLFYEEIENKVAIAHISGNIGNVYSNLGFYERALTYYSKTVYIHEELKDRYNIATDYGNIGLLYEQLSDYEKALEFYQKALTIVKELQDKTGISRMLGSIASVHYNMGKFDKALEYYLETLQIAEEIGAKKLIAHWYSGIGTSYKALGDIKKAKEYLHKSLQFIEKEQLTNQYVSYILLTIGRIAVDEKKYKIALQHFEKALQVAEEINEKKNIYESHKSLAYMFRKMRKWQKADTHFLQFYELEKELQSDDAKKQAQQFDQRRKIEEDEKNRQVKLARFEEQERIFHNILPVTIANRLIEGETTIAESYENVSIFFSDIVGFTALSSKISPKKLVNGLNQIFTTFDRIATKYGLEKIKTIGDAYMAVCGVPDEYDDHAIRASHFALEVLEAIENVHLGEEFSQLTIRIGLHCGPVVAGIIGEKKFAFDVWGDSVNIASRMESHGESGRIHCSESFATLLTNNSSFHLIPRGEISIKGKGTMNTFWLEKRK